ncbi:MAG: hypothetical protein IAF38_08170 [Bacteroidia bacterium]|nr:hypothetical protein [Bacteroidia bacterium]
MKFLKTAGYLSIFFGTLAVLFTIQPAFLVFGLLAAIIGFIFSVIFIFIKTKHQVKTGRINQGLVGMLLCSVPVLYILISIIIASNK